MLVRKLIMRLEFGVFGGVAAELPSCSVPVAVELSGESWYPRKKKLVTWSSPVTRVAAVKMAAELW
jgi:hypothetical protein